VEPTDREAFVTALVAVAEIHGKKLSTPAITLYWNVLERYPVEEVLQALSRHLEDPDVGQFMPKPADVVRNIDGSSDTRSMLAWTKAIKAASSVGSYESVVFDDWRIHAVISDMGGWISLCSIQEDELPFRAREFEKRYRGYLRRTGDYPRRLIGRNETHNVQKGHAVDPPVLIGDRGKAMLVLEGGIDGTRQLEISRLLPSSAVTHEDAAA